MAQFVELTSTPDYIYNWGILQSLRELIQNGVDEEKENGHKFSYHFREGTVTLKNEGANLTLSALLSGFTTKRGKPGLIGRNGDGLPSSLLVLTRDGYQVEIWTQQEKWAPEFKVSKKFLGSKTLHIPYRKLKKARVDVTVKVFGVEKDVWEAAKALFLYFNPPKNFLEIPDKGRILLDRAHTAKMYVYGVEISGMDFSAYPFGVDFQTEDIKINREREASDQWTVRYELSKVVISAVNRSPVQAAKLVYRLISQGASEFAGHIESRLKYMVHTEASSFIAKMQEEFWLEFGEGTLPAKDLADARELTHRGEKSAVVSPPLFSILAMRMKTLDKVIKEHIEAETELVNWTDLSAEQQHKLELCSSILQEACPNFLGLSMLSVIRMPSDAGFTADYLPSTNEIRIEAGCLDSVLRLLRVLVHEVAHMDSGASEDLTDEHQGAVEALHSKVLEIVIRKPEVYKELKALL